MGLGSTAGGGHGESSPFDVLVCGGGPAGSAVARQLSSWGRRVCLVTRPADTAGGTLAESLPPSADKLFRVLGLETDIEAAGFLRSTGNTVWWGERDARVEGFGEGRLGWQVSAPALEQVLQEAAQRAGVHLVRERVDSLAAARARWPSRWVLDCTGRTGLVARVRGWRRFEPSLRTVALVGVWDGAPWRVPDSSHTLIESYADGWAWSVPVGGGRRQIAVMVDPRRSDLARGTDARAVYGAQVQKTRQFAALVSEARLEAGPWGWDASMYSSDRYVEDGCLLVGDAGSFVDPLSSAGVKKALASAWLAAIVVNTCLSDPGLRDPALAFFESREREVYRHYRAFTVRYLAEGSLPGRAFWADRAEAGEPAVDPPSDAMDAATGRAAAAAFEALRTAPELVASRGEVTVEARPAIADRVLRLEPRIVTPERPEGLRFLDGVDLVTLIELAPMHRDVGRLFEDYNRRCATVPLPDFLRALSFAVARGWLVC